MIMFFKLYCTSKLGSYNLCLKALRVFHKSLHKIEGKNNFYLNFIFKYSGN